MKHALLELISIAIEHIDQVKNLERRAQMLEAAAEACDQAHREERALKLREVAATLRAADEAQRNLEELFSQSRD